MTGVFRAILRELLILSDFWEYNLGQCDECMFVLMASEDRRVVSFLLSFTQFC